MEPIEPHARRGDPERVGGAAIEKCVERHEEVLGDLVDAVTTAERRLDGRWIVAVHARTDEQRAAIGHEREAAWCEQRWDG